MADDQELGSVEGAVRDDIDGLGQLAGIEGSLAAMALRLSRAVDAEDDARVLAILVRETRATLRELVDTLAPGRITPRTGPAASGSEVSSDAAEDWSGMDNPV